MYTIYKITNNVNNKCYIGLPTKSSEQRFNQHIQRALHNETDFKFPRAIHKYGKGAFTVETLCTTTTHQNAIELERFYIKHFNSFKSGYNATTGGDGSDGYSVSDETKAKISESLKGHETLPETRKKISEAQKGEKSVHYGKPMLPQTKEALRKANTGRKWTDKSKAKASASRKGFKPKQESIDKMRKKLTGRKQTEETQAKKAATLKANRKFNTFKPWALRTPDGEIVVQLELTKSEYAEKHSLPTKWFYSKFNGNTIKPNKHKLLEGYAFSNLYDIISDKPGKVNLRYLTANN